MTEEDEAFEELNRKLNQKAVQDDDTMCYRNDVIEEVAAKVG